MSDPKPTLGAKCHICGRPADGDVVMHAPDTGGEPPKPEDITLVGICRSCQGPGLYERPKRGKVSQLLGDFLYRVVSEWRLPRDLMRQGDLPGWSIYFCLHLHWRLSFRMVVGRKKEQLAVSGDLPVDTDPAYSEMFFHGRQAYVGPVEILLLRYVNRTVSWGEVLGGSR